MASETKTTTDHDEIRHWAEDHGGRPATVAGTESNGEPGVLRFDFPGGAGADQLKPLEWDEWFDKFEKNDLALLYQAQSASGEESTFFKLIKR